MENGVGWKRIRPSTAEDEALKKNTDCMFFLASPLACNKLFSPLIFLVQGNGSTQSKGNACDYRHSEGAKANPRYCWYWLNGNCLNPKCLFRHLPLDGLFGTQEPSSRPVQPPSRTVAATKIPLGHALYTTNKQSVPCYYFHGPQASGNPVSQQATKVTTTPEPLLQHSHINQRQIPLGISLSTRLQGRITLPGRSSPDIPSDLQFENDGNRGRPRGRLQPPRPRNYQGRHHKRVRQRSNEEFAADARSAGIKRTRRDYTGPLDFAGPKSLAELKGAKVMKNSQELSTKSTSVAAPLELNNMKFAKGARLQYPEDSLLFEGPKPLSVILKRYREEAFANGASGGEENDRRDGENAAGGSVSVVLSDVHNNASKDITAKEEEEEGLNHGAEGSICDGCSSAKEDIFDTDDNMEVDSIEDQELANYDQTYGEFDYEAVEGGDSNSKYDENVYQQNEDEFDDEDDFAKKVSALLACM
ncbi:zinc finger CCCH domain-containing protein 32-like [Cocos nucifera]|uniref:Zinc finger CCCH domain-containing protein 32-like n=1 Tax=Cocos nucifera TaxID=13894 RepID=A0A8K0MZY6_COCNU|nr:zinc finger CCCH domain-containing protein 32-like [Cocos nucifera]